MLIFTCCACSRVPSSQEKPPSTCTPCWSWLPPYLHPGDKGQGCTRHVCLQAHWQLPRFPLQEKNPKKHILNIKWKRCMCRQMLPEWTLSPPQWLPGLGRVSSLLLAVLLRGQRKPDERQDSIVLPCGSWGRPTACGSLELTTGIYIASTAICLLMPAREIKTEKKVKWEFISKCMFFFLLLLPPGKLCMIHSPKKFWFL